MTEIQRSYEVTFTSESITEESFRGKLTSWRYEQAVTQISTSHFFQDFNKISETLPEDVFFHACFLSAFQTIQAYLTNLCFHK